MEVAHLSSNRIRKKEKVFAKRNKVNEEETKEETETRLSQQLQPLPWYYRYSSVSKTLLHLATMLLNVAHLSNALDSARDSF